MATVAVLLALVAGCYYVSLRVHPFTNCGRCKGRGRNVGSTRSRYGNCGKCGGSGRKDRLGVRLLRRLR